MGDPGSEFGGMSMVWVNFSFAVVALILGIWAVLQIYELKQRWVRLYGLRTTLTATEAALKEMMQELEKSGAALLSQLDARLAQINTEKENTVHNPAGSTSGSPKMPVTKPSSSGGISREASAGANGKKEQEKIQLQQPSTGPVNKTVSVIGLSQQGYTVEEIEAELGIPRGEVELILALRRLRE